MELWVLQDSWGPTVFLVFLVPEVRLERKVGLCPDRKETRGSRASRGLRGRLSTWTLQRTFTLKENRVHQATKVSVALRGSRVWTLFQESKERKGLWDFRDPGDSLDVPAGEVKKESRELWEVLVFQV